MAKVAPGEHWYGHQALELNLIDKLTTSDDYLLNASETADIYEISYLSKKTLADKLSGATEKAMDTIRETGTN
jgi:serine protease SohB